MQVLVMIVRVAVQMSVRVLMGVPMDVKVSMRVTRVVGMHGLFANWLMSVIGMRVVISMALVMSC